MERHLTTDIGTMVALFAAHRPPPVSGSLTLYLAERQAARQASAAPPPPKSTPEPTIETDCPQRRGN